MNKETPLLKYSQALELENKDLKQQIRKRDEEINRLVDWKHKHGGECRYITKHDRDEFGSFQWVESDCSGELEDEPPLEWEYCPWCGRLIERTSDYELDEQAYSSYVNSEIDFRRGK